MKKVNIWESMYTGQLVVADADFLPKFNGWNLVATYTVENDFNIYNGQLINQYKVEKGVK